MTLSKTEHRRKYFKTSVEEAKLLLGLTHAEAVAFVERHVLLIRAKIGVGDPICFGTGKFEPRTQPSRAFNLITSEGCQQRTEYGERTLWRLKMFKRGIDKNQ